MSVEMRAYLCIAVTSVWVVAIPIDHWCLCEWEIRGCLPCQLYYFHYASTWKAKGSESEKMHGIDARNWVMKYIPKRLWTFKDSKETDN